MSAANQPLATPTVWTVRALVNWTTTFLASKGIEFPQKEARILLGHVMDCKPIDVIARYDDEPTDQERTQFKDLIKRRVEGWPVAYLTGQREFYLLSFDVTPAVLIPRPDTEQLVMQALDVLKGQPAPRILDLGTGSGCIAVSLAHQCKTATVTAVDVSPDALEVAKRNAVKHGVTARMNFVVGDLFNPIAADSTFDLIVSNPPYVTPTEITELAPDVRDHEPRIALDGGPDGLAFYRRITMDAAKYLAVGGRVMVEIGWTQEPAVRALFEARPEFTDVKSMKDLGNRWRVVTAKKA